MTIASGRATPGQPTVIAAGAPDFDQARQAFNLAVDQRPQEVAYPSDAGDVTASGSTYVVDSIQVAPKSGSCDYRRATAFTSGGCQVALADGSVRMVNASLSSATWSAAVLPADGLPLGSDW